MEKIKVTIAGEHYNLSTDDDAEYLLSLAEEVNGKIGSLVHSNSRVSVTQAAVLTVLEYADAYKKAVADCDNLRTRIRDYLEEAAKSRSEAEIARRENEKLTKELNLLKGKR